MDILTTLEESSSRALKKYLVSLLKDFFKTDRTETFLRNVNPVTLPMHGCSSSALKSCHKMKYLNK